MKLNLTIEMLVFLVQNIHACRCNITKNYISNHDYNAKVMVVPTFMNIKSKNLYTKKIA